MIEKQVPTAKARDLKPEEYKKLSTVDVFFEYSERAIYKIQASFWLTGHSQERKFHFQDVMPEELKKAFPDRGEMALKNAEELRLKLPLRITIGRTSNNNSLGFYGRFEFIVNDDKRNVLARIFPNEILEFICENHRAISDYLIWKDSATPGEVLKALKKMRESEN